MSDTQIIIAIVAFQTFIILSLGFLNVGYVEGSQQVTTVDSGVEIFNVNFGFNLMTNITALGAFNVLIFSPLLVGVGYIIAKLIRGGG